MKYFAFILGLLFLSLALLPCQDDEDAPGSEVLVSIYKTHPGDQHSAQESCPPFCSCYCCASARQFISQISLTVFSKTVLRIYPECGISPVQTQSIKIWQPPRLV